MKIQDIIDRLNEIKAEYGNIAVVGYDVSERNIDLTDSSIGNIQVLFNEKVMADYVEIEFNV